MNFGDTTGQDPRSRGSRVAAGQGEHSLTFRRFDERSYALGRLLLESGLQPGDRVAVFLGNRLEWFDAWSAPSRPGWSASG